MRPVSLVIAIAAGTAVRFLLRKLPPFRRRRRIRSRQSSSSAQSATLKRIRHPQIQALLDQNAPQISAHEWQSKQLTAGQVECTFCLETIRPSSDCLRVTGCSHVFHAHCLEQWVMYTADSCLDWHHYTLSDDGSIESHVRPPTCPNCSADLNVLPPKLVRNVMLTSVARSLSLRDLSAAAEMYDAGLVYRAAPQYNSQPHPHPRPPARYVRTDSTTSESALVSAAGQVQFPRRSFPEEMAAVVQPPVLTHTEQRRRRSTSRLGLPDFVSSQVALQASS